MIENNTDMIHKIFAREVINDYFTANIKAEILFDTILTPVISDILTEVCSDRISGKMSFITKEFPLKEKNTFRTHNADYLMRDDKYVYLVELKSTQDSINSQQMEYYWSKVCERKECFGKKLGPEFIRILNRVSRTGISEWGEEKELEKIQKEDLMTLFERIISYSKKRKCLNERSVGTPNYALQAMEYLKENKVCSSKKYLFTAGQILDHMGDGKWWDHEIKLLYLVPGLEKKAENEFEKNSILWVSIREIIQEKQRKQIRDRIEKKERKEYWDWASAILKQCME